VTKSNWALGVIGSLALGLGGCDGGSQTADQGEAAATSAADGSAAVAGRLAALERRAGRIADIDAIKRLQHAYGYYADEALWDEMASLFAANGTIEIGLDGVYVGRERIREYLYALGGGEAGLAAGELSEHMQVMPVITLAPDGQKALGRWRAILMLGTLGESALWGEGPYENEYVKEDGVWKIGKLHWYQSVVVPYEGGWQVNEDVNGGRWVSAELAPDAPPSVEYETWPGTYLPPFHFPNPVLGAVAASPARATSTRAEVSSEALAHDAAVLAREVQSIEDENDIEKLQRIYGFYIDKGLWSEAAALFADDGTIEMGGQGVYVGKERVLEYLRTLGAEFPQERRLFDQMQLQPVIDVAPNGLTAKGRWRLFAQEAVHGEYARWGVGVYENGYVKDDGVWKIQSLHQFNTMYAPYEDGWGKTALPNPGPLAALPPDRPPTVPHEAYPAAFVAPFHYENPVTGRSVGRVDVVAEPVIDGGDLEAALDALERDITRLEDMDALERLNSVYGYYLAHNQWDDLTGLFASDGTIEIAMRGVYAGSASVRRNLNLYGEAGIHHGLLHNHMQFQPVIDVAEDGRTAAMRSRAFSIMGQYDTYSMWMGGVYENDFVKENGVWKIKRDQVFNTYFAQYAVGWKDLAPRPPPGITEANPPDSPPTHPFEMYPRAFLPPFHYANPVTGDTVVWP
jgi:SnoaL-like domain